MSYIVCLRNENNDVSHVIIGGDFNVDFNRDWANTSLLRDFCTELNLYPVINHRSSTIAIALFLQVP